MTFPTGIKANNIAKLVAAFIIAGGMVSMIMAYRFAASEQTREKLMWQNRISVVLNSRVDVVADWISAQSEIISNLAQNDTVGLFFSNISGELGLGEQGEDALFEYLSPLLNDRASQGGFHSQPSGAVNSIRANISQPRHSGLALVNLQGQILQSTPAMPPVFEAINGFVAAGARQDTMMVGPYIGETGHPTLAFIKPVFGIEQDGGGDALGFVVGVRLLGDDFFDQLRQPGELTTSAQNYLVRKQGEMIHYIQNANIQDANYKTAINTKLNINAEKIAMENPARMVEAINGQGRDVFAAGKNIPGTDWTLIRSIEAEEVLDGANQRKRSILFISGLVIISVGIMMALLWRHGISVRLQQAVKKQKALAKKHENLSAFMSVVTNSQPTEISAVDENGNYTFINLQAALSAGSQPENMIGKAPSDVLGRARARVDALHCEEVLEQNSRQTKIQNSGSEEEPRIIKTDYLPLIVGDDNDIHEKGVLMVKEDITQLEQSRMKRELGLKSLVSTLTTIIASRDPFSAAHSTRVVDVTSVIAKELAVDETTVATAELAGAMMNLGKILVPRELLIKPTGLTDDELTIIRSSMLKSADLIKDIEFEGPVAETLRQMQAHWDGSGTPAGLSGEAILLPARIVSVANAFVGMTSARAYRSGMDMRKAVDILLSDADKVFDRGPVVALLNYLENKGGYDQWQHFAEPPKSNQP